MIGRPTERCPTTGRRAQRIRALLKAGSPPALRLESDAGTRVALRVRSGPTADRSLRSKAPCSLTAELVATLILADTYAGWKGSLPEEEVRARLEGVRRMLAAPAEEFDPTPPGLFAGDPPAEFVQLLKQDGRRRPPRESSHRGARDGRGRPA